MVCMELLFMDEIHEFLNAVTGFDYTPEEIRKTAQRIFTLEQAFNNRLGIRSKDDTLPKRFLTEPLPMDSGPSAGQIVHLQPMLKEYYNARGFDPNTGIPTEDTLMRLGLDDVSEDLKKLR